MDGATAIGTVALEAASTATLLVSAPAVGAHSYTATYSGDLCFSPSQAAAKKVTVKKDTVKATLVPPVGTYVPGQPLTLNATVVITAGTNTPTGSVTFMDGSRILGAAPLDGSGAAALVTAFSTAGVHALAVTYGGDGQTNAAKSAAAKFTVAKAATQIAFTSPDASIAAGATASFTAQVAALAPAALTPTGKVIIKEGTKTLATLTLAAGQALWTTPLTLAPGLHLLTAAYQGDANDLLSVSTVFSLTIT